MDYLCVLTSMACLGLSIKDRMWLPFPTGIILIICASQIAFCCVHEGVLVSSLYEIVNNGGLKEKYIYTQCLYSSIAALSYLSLKTADRKQSLSRFIEEMRILAQQRNFADRPIVAWFFVMLLIHTSIFLFVIDWHKLWHHTVYLDSILDRDAGALVGFGMASIIIKTSVFTYVLSLFGFFLTLNGRSRAMRLVFFLIAFFYFVQFLGFDSRFATAFPALMALFYLIGNYKYKKIVIGFLLSICAFTLIFALEGRGSGNHGISSIATNAGYLFDKSIKDTLTTLLLNVSEGVFETSEALQLRISFPTIYKVVSFSPLPSVIDGYSYLMSLYQVRLHKYVPMPGIAEVQQFGAFYVFLLACFFWVVIRTHIQVAVQSGVAFIMCNLLIMASIYHMLAYPLRNALHFAWIAFFIALAVKGLGGTALSIKSRTKVTGLANAME